MKFAINIFKTTSVLLILLILFLALPISYADSYSYNGVKLNTNYVLVFVPDSDFGSVSISHFNSALWRWNDAADIDLMRREPTTRHSETGYPVNDNRSLIYKKEHLDLPAGATQIHLSVSDPTIVKSADILINSAYTFTNGANITSTQYDTWTVFIHEAGHVAGLGHCEETENVMQVSGAGVIKRNLGSGDKTGISNLY